MNHFRKCSYFRCTASGSLANATELITRALKGVNEAVLAAVDVRAAASAITKFVRGLFCLSSSTARAHSCTTNCYFEVLLKDLHFTKSLFRVSEEVDGEVPAADDVLIKHVCPLASSLCILEVPLPKHWASIINVIDETGAGCRSIVRRRKRHHGVSEEPLWPAQQPLMCTVCLRHFSVENVIEVLRMVDEVRAVINGVSK